MSFNSKHSTFMFCYVYEVGLEVSLLDAQFSFLIFFQINILIRNFLVKNIYFPLFQTLLCFPHLLLLGIKTIC